MMTNEFSHSKHHYAQRKHQSEVFGGQHVSMKATVIANERIVHPQRVDSIVIGEAGGRVHYPPIYSDYVEEPHHKQMPWHLEHSAEYVERGKKYLVGKVPGEDKREGKRYLEANPTGINTFHHDWNIKTRAACNESYLYDMEGYMNRKQRITSLEQQRNGVPVATSGDKFYKEADREPGFYQKGGLIPGSTIVLRKSGKPQFKKVDDSRKTASFKSTMTFAEKTKRAELENDLMDIRDLDNPSEKLKQMVPSWEERTGSYLVRPEDEKY